MLEIARKNKDIGGSLDAQVALYVGEKNHKFLESVCDTLPLVFICSKVILNDVKAVPVEAVTSEQIKDLNIIVKKSQYKKCIRCWNYRDTVGVNKNHPEICERCAKSVS